MQTDPQMEWPEEQGPQTNVLGVVGFGLSFCLSPLGLLVSLVALTKQPRGFAVAGTAIGVLGTLVWGCAGFVYVKFGDAFVKTYEVMAEYEQMKAAVAVHASSHDGALPEDLAGVGLRPEALKDPWGNDYKYERTEDGKSWTLTVASFDGQFGTADDLVLTSSMSMDEVQGAISRMMEAHFGVKGGSTAP